jgi:hypothetical protein
VVLSPAADNNGFGCHHGEHPQEVGGLCDFIDAEAREPEAAREYSNATPLVEPENADLVAEIRKVRTERDHVVAETNEIVADLFSGKCVYATDVERIMSDRSVIARTKLLGLHQLLARVVLGTTEEQAIGQITEEIEQIAAELKQFDAADFRAQEVRERVSEPDNEEPDKLKAKVSGWLTATLRASRTKQHSYRL